MTREEIQKQALEVLKENNYHGTICLSTGTGKSKTAIDAIKDGGFKNILITSPRTNLKENWNKELEKWGQQWLFGDTHVITIENIQTCYKWPLEKIQQFDYIIQDEIHTMATPEYGRLINLAKAANIPVTGLTATSDAHKEEKRLFYETYCPIIYEYYDSAEDGIVNKRKYIIYNYELTDDYTVTAGTKKKSWEAGEATQYQYLSDQIKKGQILMSRTGSTDWFKDAADWFWKKQGTPEQRNAAMIYLNAVKFRKNFLWNLNSSADIATKIKNLILEAYREKSMDEVDKNGLEGYFSSFPGFHSIISDNKVLLFSELTKQAEKLSPYRVHSKQDDEINKLNLQKFDSGEIRELASCNSLTLGLNIKGANYAIMESFSGSTTGLLQKAGRLDRLAVEDIATIIFIVPKDTQTEQWFKLATKNIDLSEAIYINNLKDFTI